MPQVATFFAAFLALSLFVLLLIVAVKAPEFLRSVRRFSRQMQARKTRGERMLADPEKLKADARRLEGVYRFDNPEHTTGAYRKAEIAASAGITSRESLR